ncbi:MAG TPA: polyphosphate kinase 2 family protein [Xanthobacteraceae bacterium]|jgi:PPK2 family polyphosphate:nucleotide phosphotransferase|nr:polyphosphate kinase 2 family protein [Xanthobacteraceae bacterium]
MNFAKIIKRFRIEKAHGFRLSDFDPADTCGLDIGKAAAKDMIADGLRHLTAMQEKLYAQNQWALLIILQGMDASGKDGVIKHVMSGLNPQGCEVHAFKHPSAEDLEHDFLWRAARRLPARGRIGIFNRSYYEDVLVVRVRRELLGRQNLPAQLVTKAIWSERFNSIRAFERHLALNGTLVLKFHLRISKEEQRQRLLARLDEPSKRWKFSMDDVDDRKLWGRYMEAYEDAIRNTATAEAPWYIVPADHKWFAWLTVAAAIGGAMERLKLEFPLVRGKALEELERVRRALGAAK